MSDVTITITVSSEGDSIQVGTQPLVPASHGSVKSGATTAAEHEADELAGPPPLDLAELGAAADDAADDAATIGDVAEPEDLAAYDAAGDDADTMGDMAEPENLAAYDVAASDADDEAPPSDPGEA